MDGLGEGWSLSECVHTPQLHMYMYVGSQPGNQHPYNLNYSTGGSLIVCKH